MKTYKHSFQKNLSLIPPTGCIVMEYSLKTSVQDQNIHKINSLNGRQLKVLFIMRNTWREDLPSRRGRLAGGKPQISLNDNGIVATYVCSQTTTANTRTWRHRTVFIETGSQSVLNQQEETARIPWKDLTKKLISFSLARPDLYNPPLAIIKKISKCARHHFLPQV